MHAIAYRVEYARRPTPHAVNAPELLVFSVKQLYWTLCKKADQEHRRNKRQYAHTFHYKNCVCLARAFANLPAKHQDAIVLHEVGHLIAGPNATEEEANKAIEDRTGITITYADTRYGKDLERI
jgi:hypothetical protein